MILANEPVSDSPTLAEVIQQAIQNIQIKTGNPRLEAEVLLCAVLGKTRTYLRAYPEYRLSEPLLGDFQALIAQRAAGQPVAYLLGTREFWSRPFTVSRDTLIPRPETELLVERTLSLLPEGSPRRILELGTGSGIIAITLQLERPENAVTAVELSEAALAIARKNAENLEASTVTFLSGSWYEPIEGDLRFDLIVSNPPYIAENDPHLVQGDLLHEPQIALRSGHEGLDALRHIIQKAPDFLNPGGSVLVEHGYQQAADVADLMTAAGFQTIAHFKDLQGHLRVTTATL